MKQTVTLKDIAEALDLSINTVSKVLSGQAHAARISEKTILRVIQKANELGYIPNQSARNLRAKRTGLIGVFIADMTDPVYAGIADAIFDALTAGGFFPVISVAQAGLALCREMWGRNRVEGILFCGTTPEMDDTFFKTLTDQEVACAIAGSHCMHLDGRDWQLPVSSISVNNYAGIHMAIRHLQKTGRKTIGFIAGPMHDSDAYERKLAYQQIIQSTHPPIILDVDSGERFWQRGFHAAEQLYRQNIKLDALVCYDDLVAVGAIRWLHKQGIRVPEDIAVVGFDNHPQAEFITPSLTTIEQPTETIGRKSVEVLKNQIYHKEKDIERIEIIPSLIVRESAPSNTP